MNEYLIETIEKEHVTVKIYQEIDAMNPREWDNLGTMVCWHNQYELGDKNGYDSVREFYVDLAGHVLNDDEWDSVYSDYEIPVVLMERITKEFHKEYIILPLYLYDHGGITMRTAPFYSSWDSGQVGFIYISKEQVRKDYGWKYITAARANKIMEYLKSEVETYDQYLTGDVYGFVAECKVCGESAGSCWGFYGQNWKENGLLDQVWDNPCEDCESIEKGLNRVMEVLG